MESYRNKPRLGGQTAHQVTEREGGNIHRVMHRDNPEMGAEQKRDYNRSDH
ncbi:hypothetical protein DSECCO2_555570 [anaerobic digester metagenome]